MIFGKAATSKRLAARAFEVEAGGVHEHEIERAEKTRRRGNRLPSTTSSGRGGGRGGGLVDPRSFSPSPAPGEGMRMGPPPADPPPAPPRGPPKGREGGGTPTRGGGGAMTSRQPVSSHNRSNASAGPMRRTELVVATPAANASTTMAFAAKRAPERSRRSSWPLSRKSSTRPSVAMTCWRTASPSRRLSTIWR